MAAMEHVLTETVAVLMAEDLVTFPEDTGCSEKRVAQDGMRVRASAGSSSFHRKKKLGPAEGGPGGGRCCGWKDRSSDWLSSGSIPTAIAANGNEQPGSGRQRQLPEVRAAKERQARHPAEGGRRLSACL